MAQLGRYHVYRIPIYFGPLKFFLMIITRMTKLTVEESFSTLDKCQKLFQKPQSLYFWKYFRKEISLGELTRQDHQRWLQLDYKLLRNHFKILMNEITLGIFRRMYLERYSLIIFIDNNCLGSWEFLPGISYKNLKESIEI